MTFRRGWFPILFAATLISTSVCQGQETGLEILRLNSPQKSAIGDSLITVVRIDPTKYQFRLLCASEHGRRKRTVKQWCAEFGLVGAINAGMFQKDGYTSTGFMKSFGHVNNPSLNRNYKSFFAFDPKDPLLPYAQIFDDECEGYASLGPRYNCVVQNIRMISCARKNVWSPQPKKWSTASLGTDGKGRVLFLFTRSPYSVHEFINILLSLDIDIQRAMYLEGGPEASLYVKEKNREVLLFGSFETAFNENDDNNRFWSLPNVIGIVPR